MADIFDVDNQENYDIPMSHEPSEEDYLASFEDKTIQEDIVYPGGIHPSMNQEEQSADTDDFFTVMSEEKWIPEITDKYGILEWGNLQERINMDSHQLEMWGQSETNATNPKHYNQVPAHLQHWDVVEQMGWGYHLGCATKYIWRAGKKTSSHLTNNQKEIEDLQKSIVYIQKRIELLTNI